MLTRLAPWAKIGTTQAAFGRSGCSLELGRVAGLVGIKLLTTSHPVQKAPISPDGESNDSHRTRFSVEFYRLTRSHLKPDGIYYFNTTQSDETIATELSVCPYGFRVFILLAIGETPIIFNTQMWLSVPGRYKIDGRNLFDSADPVAQRVLARSALLQRTLDGPPTFVSIETSELNPKAVGEASPDYGRQYGVRVAATRCLSVALKR
jgi:hypothetical protein